jgi:hypothetical protein
LSTYGLHHILHGRCWCQFALRHTQMIDDCQLPILLNLAQVALLLGERESTAGEAGAAARPHRQLRACVAYCNRALKLDASNVKALYRRALARERSGDAEEALPGVAAGDTHARSTHTHTHR